MAPRVARRHALTALQPDEEEPPRTPTCDLLQNRAYLMKEDWGGPDVQPLTGLARAEELNHLAARAEVI